MIDTPVLSRQAVFEARIVTWEEPSVLKVAAGALFREGDGWAVFTVSNGRAQLRQIQVGKSNGLETQIISGLAEGDQVILHPSDRVRGGIRVRPRTPY